MGVRLFGQRIAKPEACPLCGVDVLMPMMKAYRYAGGEREHVGDVCNCVACGGQVTVLRAGGVIRYRPVVSPEKAAELLHGGVKKLDSGGGGIVSLDPDVNDLGLLS